MWQYISEALAGILSFVLDILPIGGFLKKKLKMCKNGFYIYRKLSFVIRTKRIKNIFNQDTKAWSLRYTHKMVYTAIDVDSHANF